MNFGKLKGLVIATPFYEVKAYSPYITSLVNSINLLHTTGIPYTYYEVSGDSYVDRAKNSLIHRFLKDDDYSHILMIDSDESWELEGFKRLLKDIMYGFEIVGGLYPCKNNWEFYGGVPLYAEDGRVLGKEVPEEDIRVIDMWCIPGGFICYSKEAFDKTRPLLKSYQAPETGEWILEAFKCNIEENGGRIGEDVYFQQRYKEAGGKVWCEPNMTVTHFGVKGWTGNYQEFLLKEKAKHEIDTVEGRDKLIQKLKEFNQKNESKSDI